MLLRLKIVAAVAVLVFASAVCLAQDARPPVTDQRLYPFLGCWRSDTVGTRSARLGALTCVVPVAGSPDVELLNLVDGRVSSRRRIDASSRAHEIEGQGCRGQERTAWSPLVRRIYLRAEYVCGTGIAGGTTTLYSFLPTGEWLEVENVRSGGGSIVRTERRRDAGIPNNLPREIAGQIGAQRLAVVTSRAEAASPLGPDDVVEALHNTDSAVVRAWLIETGQHFALTGDQVASLARAEVPPTVLQAVMATPPKYQLGVGVDSSGRSVDAYLSTPGWAPAFPYGYPYYGHYAYYPYYPYHRVYYEPYPYYGCCYPGYASYTSVTTFNNNNYSYPGRSYGGGYADYYSPYRGYPSYSSYPTYSNYRAYSSPSFYSGSVGVRPAGQVRVMPASPGPGGRRP